MGFLARYWGGGATPKWKLGVIASQGLAWLWASASSYSPGGRPQARHRRRQRRHLATPASRVGEDDEWELRVGCWFRGRPMRVLHCACVSCLLTSETQHFVNVSWRVVKQRIWHGHGEQSFGPSVCCVFVSLSLSLSLSISICVIYIYILSLYLYIYIYIYIYISLSLTLSLSLSLSLYLSLFLALFLFPLFVVLLNVNKTETCLAIIKLEKFWIPKPHKRTRISRLLKPLFNCKKVGGLKRGGKHSMFCPSDSVSQCLLLSWFCDFLLIHDFEPAIMSLICCVDEIHEKHGFAQPRWSTFLCVLLKKFCCLSKFLKLIWMIVALL